MAKRTINKRSKAYKRRKKRRAIFLVELVVLLVLVAGLFIYAKANNMLGKLNQKDLDMNKVEVNEDVKTNKKLKGYTNIALFGLDSREAHGLERANSDSIIIASINNDTKDIRLVSVYRDTYLDIGENTYNKCNAAYNLGGPERAISMLNTNLDLNITQYLSVDFDALIETIDLLGGIEIGVDELEYVHVNNYCVEQKKITGRSYEELPGPGTYNMSGMQATAYARIRYTAGNDFKRTERQREVIERIVDKAKKSDLATLSKVADQVFPMVLTSLTKEDIISMGTTMLSYKIGEKIGFPFDHIEDNIGKKDCVIPVTLESNVVQLHEFLFADEAYVPSEALKKRSNQIMNDSGKTLESLKKKTEPQN